MTTSHVKTEVMMEGLAPAPQPPMLTLYELGAQKPGHFFLFKNRMSFEEQIADSFL
jgi:hypothetical protein